METPSYELRFEATQNEPPFLDIFSDLGGTIGEATIPLCTDFGASGGKFASFAQLGKQPVPLAVGLDQADIVVKGGTVYLPSDMRLNMSTLRVGAAINGTLVNSVAGEGSDFLYHLFQKGRGHAQVGLTYSSWRQHAASVGVSDMRVVVADGTGKETLLNVQFRRRHDEVFRGTAAFREPDFLAQLRNAASYGERYAEAAWKVRQTIKYAPSPFLTKTVYKDSVGVAGKGYCLLHDIVERGQPYSNATLDSLFEQAITAHLAFDRDKLQEFSNATRTPGLLAAKQAPDVASATSMVVSFLMAYRSDGRNVVSQRGTKFESAESWLRQLQRTPVDANDCDGSGLLSVGILTSVQKLSPEQLEKHTWLRAVRNALCPHYQVATAIVGATSAEATSAGSSATVAGHLIAFLMPSLSLLEALDKASEYTQGESEVQRIAGDNREEIARVRFNALFKGHPADVQSSIDNSNLASFDEYAKSRPHILPPLAIEGTTPSAADIYVDDDRKREKIANLAQLDKLAAAKLGYNVFRSVKYLHVSGKAASAPHSFYKDIVEVTFPRSHPLWKNPAVRDANVAASQYVMADEVDSKHVSACGVSPKHIHQRKFILVPLVTVVKSAAEVFDIGSEEAARHVVPPRDPSLAMEMTAHQTATYNESLKHLRDLQEFFAAKEPQAGGHSLMHIAAFSTIVHNAQGVRHFCERLKKTATAVQVDGLDAIIPGLSTENGADNGRFVSVNCSVSM